MDIPELSKDVKELEPKSSKKFFLSQNLLGQKDPEKRKKSEKEVRDGIIEFYVKLAENLNKSFKSVEPMHKLFYLLIGFYRPQFLSKTIEEFAFKINVFFEDAGINYVKIMNFRKEFEKYRDEEERFKKKFFKKLRNIKEPQQPSRDLDYKKLDRTDIDKFFNEFDEWLAKIQELEGKIPGMLKKSVIYSGKLNFIENFSKVCIDKYVENNIEDIKSLITDEWNSQQEKNGKNLIPSLMKEKKKVEEEIEKMKEKVMELEKEVGNINKKELSKEIEDLEEMEKKKSLDKSGLKKLKEKNETLESVNLLIVLKSQNGLSAKSRELDSLIGKINKISAGDVDGFVNRLGGIFNEIDINNEIEEIKDAHKRIKNVFNSMYDYIKD